MHTFFLNYNWLRHAESLFRTMYYSLYLLTYVEVLLYLTVYLSWYQRLFKGEPILLAMIWLNEEQYSTVFWLFMQTMRNHDQHTGSPQNVKCRENEHNVSILANLFSSLLRSPSPIPGDIPLWKMSQRLRWNLRRVQSDKYFECHGRFPPLGILNIEGKEE